MWDDCDKLQQKHLMQYSAVSCGLQYLVSAQRTVVDRQKSPHRAGNQAKPEQVSSPGFPIVLPCRNPLLEFLNSPRKGFTCQKTKEQMVSVRILPHSTHSTTKLPLYFEEYLKFFKYFRISRYLFHDFSRNP
jgi:hypothetical protein